MLAIVIPAHNEQSTIYKVVEECVTITPHVIVVDDASTDLTPVILKSTNAKILTNKFNLGYESTILKGIEFSFNTLHADYCITIDADGQHPISAIKNIESFARSNLIDIIVFFRPNQSRLSEYVV